MPSDRDVALVRAGLVAAKQYLMTVGQHGWAMALDLRLDPAAIAATVPENPTPMVDTEAGEVVSTESGCAFDAVNADFAKGLEREISALRARVAEAEALEIILEAATEGTDWVYAEVPQQITALRQRVAELEHALDAEQLGAEQAQARIAELELELATARLERLQ